MIALDANVIVRFLMRHDAAQARTVYARFKQADDARERLFVPLVVTLETLWVLESAYYLSREEILDSLEDLLRMAVLEFEGAETLQNVLRDGRRSNADLADLLIAQCASASGCDAVLTFDKGAAKQPFFHPLK